MSNQTRSGRLLAALAGGVVVASAALAHDFTFQRAGGSVARDERLVDMILVPGGNIFAVGSRQNSAVSFEPASLAQTYDPNGVMLSQFMLGGPTGDVAFSATQFTDLDSSGQVIAIHTGVGNTDGRELALVRMSPGNTAVSWAARYVGRRDGYVGDGGAVKVLPLNNNIVVASNANGASPEFYPAGGLLMVNGGGAQIFNYAYTPTPPAAAAVDFADMVADPTTDSFLVVGTYNDLVGSNENGSSDILVARLTSEGTVVWAKRYALANPDAPETDSFDQGVGITLRPDGKLVVSARGTFSFNGYGSSAFLLLDASGDLHSTLGVQSFQPANSATENGPNNEVIVGGSYSFGDGGLNASMLAVDENLALKWRYTYGSAFTGGEAVVYAPDDHAPGHLLAGMANNYDNTDHRLDGYLIRTTLTGETFCDEQPWQDVIPVNVAVSSVSLVATPQGGSVAWSPALTLLAPDTRDLCTPVPPCPADFNGDGFLDFTDFDEFVIAFENGEARADFNEDGFLDFTDFDAFVTEFEEGC